MYPLRMRLAILSPSGEVVARVDTTRNFFSATPIPNASHLLGRLPVHVPPGEYSARVALESGMIGVVAPRQSISVASFSGRAMALSDLAIGTRAVRLAMPGPRGDSAWINPLHSFARKQAMELYAELGGLAVGAVYRIDISVARLNSNGEIAGKGTVALKFGVDAKKAMAVDVIRREVSLARLSPGDYLVALTVSTAAGEHATRQQRFTVTKE
jgi:hypothetical protein